MVFVCGVFSSVYEQFLLYVILELQFSYFKSDFGDRLLSECGFEVDIDYSRFNEFLCFFFLVFQLFYYGQNNNQLLDFLKKCGFLFIVSMIEKKENIVQFFLSKVNFSFG